MSWTPTTKSLPTERACAVLTLLLPIQAAFGGSGLAGQQAVVDTVGGRPVATTEFPRPGEDDEAWRLVEELRLGNVAGEGPEGFGGIADLAVDRAGHIYVLDVGSKEVRVFDRGGGYLRSLARDGGGPGEFRYRATLNQRITWRAPNELWIDDGFQRIVVDASGKELGRSAPRRPFFVAGELPASRWVIAAARDGSLFSLVQVVAIRSPDQADIPQHTFVVRSPVSPDRRLLPGDTLAIETGSIVAGARDRSTDRGGNTIVVQSLAGAEPRFVWAAESDGTLWLAHRARYRFDRLAFTGDTIRMLQVGDAEPLPADDPGFAPVLAGLASSPEGWLWVQREVPATAGGSTWDVLDNCGRYRALASVPVGLRRVKVGAGGAVYGISSDELGIDFVHRFRLRSETGSSIGAEVCPF